MEKYDRKSNRLSDYDYTQEGCYFVTLCTQNRKNVFVMEEPVGNGLRAVPDNLSNQLIHKWIRETQNKYDNVQIDKYVIMPDHLHMIISITERHAGRSLQEIMAFFKTMTTNAYMQGVREGKLPAFDKKLWQKSYYDHVIRNQQDYNEIWEYIQNNPKKWLLTHNK